MNRMISDLSFEYVGILRLKRDVDGRAIAYTHRLGREVKPNRYASGRFCDFDLVERGFGTGVYALTVGDEVKYIGECESLEKRFRPIGYGHVSPRNCHADGQATNCRINSLVLQVSGAQDRVSVWFLRAAVDRKSIESRLIRELDPPWNGQMPIGSRDANPSVPPSGTRSTRSAPDGFRVALQELFAAAEKAGQHVLRIRAGDLHRRLGGYPGLSHKMPQCCRAMREAMTEGDIVIDSPPKGAGANFVIEYRLPRDLGLVG